MALTLVHNSIFLFCTTLILVGSSQPPRALECPSPTPPEPELPDHTAFARDLFLAIACNRQEENVVVSPGLINTGLALAFIGAAGATASEMRQGLKLGTISRQEIAVDFGEFLTGEPLVPPPDAPTIVMANRIFVNECLEIAGKFKRIAARYFESKVVLAPFSHPKEAVKRINYYVERQTLGAVTNLLKPHAVCKNSSIVVLNAFVFKTKWAKPFNPTNTEICNFHISPEEKRSVPLMQQTSTFQYTDLPELDATGLILPMSGSNLRMFIVLPNKVDGLAQLENCLKTANLTELASRTSPAVIEVYIPKLKIEFDIELRETLETMGMPTMFSEDACFQHMFEQPTKPQRLSAVQHKAILEIDECGVPEGPTEDIRDACVDKIEFRADHPFVFSIYDDHFTYLSGHLANIEVFERTTLPGNVEVPDSTQ